MCETITKEKELISEKEKRKKNPSRLCADSRIIERGVSVANWASLNDQ
jgi:hypothetical protein